MLSTTAGGGLVGGCCHELHQTCLVQGAHAHQHAAYCAVTTNEIFDALVQSLINNRLVHRVKHNHGVIPHAQCLGGINPVTRPACLTQGFIDLFGVVTSLAGQHNITFLKRRKVVGIVEAWLNLWQTNKRGR